MSDEAACLLDSSQQDREVESAVLHSAMQSQALWVRIPALPFINLVTPMFPGRWPPGKTWGGRGLR